HFLKNKSLGVEVLGNWIKDQDSEVLIHLTPNCLMDFSDWVEKLDEIEQLIFLATHNPILVEDFTMLLISSRTNGRILTRDHFRKEKENFGQIFGPEVFNKVFDFKVRGDQLITDISEE
ncbi:MAG: hypothetical protein VYB40_03520, partial [Candidatus Thermoplasmatota archaeon]|nr:hypothetical protein [Candidatus Thermoplasmatota archaeon]